MAERIYDKINLPTNTTDIGTYANYLTKIRENSPVKIESAHNLFAKVKATGRKKTEDAKKDTHNLKTLEDYGLIEVSPESGIKLSNLGKELEDCLNQESRSYTEEEHVSIMLRIFMSWHYTDSFGRDIHPGYIIVKLICDDEVGYITNHELALFVSTTNIKYDSQYNEIKKIILNFRNSEIGIHGLVSQTKSKTYLTALVSKWKIFRDESVELSESQKSTAFKYLSDYLSSKNPPVNPNSKLEGGDKNKQSDFYTIMKYQLSDGAAEVARIYLDFIDMIKYKPEEKSTHLSVKTKIELSNMDSRNKSYLTAIHTKPFLILGGFSGTGKSQKVKELAYLTCPECLQDIKTPGNYFLISVKPNWHDSTELLGYESTIASKYMVTDFMRFVIKAMQYPKTPFFCCMDEMNLAPVEEYFAEFLSVLESRKKVKAEDGTWQIVSEPLVSADVFNKAYKSKDDNNVMYNIFEDLGLKKVGRTVSQNEVNSIGQSTETTSEVFEREDIVTILKRDGLCIPENLVVIGTVNMDDTTNSFSRKVIDRAMIFETDIETFDKDKYFNADDTLQYGNVDGAAFICDEVRADKAIEDGYELSEEDRKAIIDYINELNKAMVGTSFQISYRVLNEMILYYRSMQMLNDGNVSLEQVKNDILMMKVLPRIEGDSAAKKALVGLKAMIEKQNNIPAEWINIPYDIDAETLASKPKTPWKDSILKIAYMLNLLNTGDGFTRFWK